MARLWKILKILWHGASALSTLQWLLGLLPAGALAVIVALIAWAERLPPVVIGLIAFAAATIAYVAYVGVLLHRQQTQPRTIFDTEPTPERIGFGDHIEGEIVGAGHIYGIASGILDTAEGRCRYAQDVIDGRKSADDWFNKVARLCTQGVPFDDLESAPRESLTAQQHKALNVSLGKLRQLRDFIKSVIENPDGYDAGAATPYLHRARNVKESLEELISELAPTEQMLRVTRLVHAPDSQTGNTIIRLEIENPTGLKIEGLRASLVSSEPPLSEIDSSVGLPIVLCTKARLDRDRAGIEPRPQRRFEIGPHEKKEIEVLQIGPHWDAWTTHEGGVIHHRVSQEPVFTVEVSGAGSPVVAQIKIATAESGGPEARLLV